MSLLIGDKLVVSIHYTLTDDNENVIDSSDGAEPLNYLHGAGNIIPGLEKELVGKVQGDKLTVRVSPEEGYGEINPELIQTVDKSLFQGVDEIQPGMQFQAQGPGGQVQMITVRLVEGDAVTVDANHPLAGQHLNFDVEVVSVREASEEEIAHGHVH
jgi:FKBP-type peptidyl-prolyl cis-trans isomerase SlyD